MTEQDGFLGRFFARLTALMRPHPMTAPARELYERVVTRARRPDFFGDDGAPDTLEGRFDMVSLYAAMAMVGLKGEGAQSRALSQRMFDIMFKEFDDGLRALGVGDTSVPKRIKKMASAFYGRLKAYDDALAADDKSRFVSAVGRNVLGAEDHPRAQALADDARAFLDHIRARSAASSPSVESAKAA